jgi:xanthine dehydrogenase YagS FAD-binding subunit
MKPFEYVRPKLMYEALALLEREADGTRVLAGGTDLLPLMKAGIDTPERLLDIKRLDGLSREIEETPQGMVLGALTPLAEVETHVSIQQGYPLLAEAAALAATPQLRNMATLGGNLLQRPRCWYFRSPYFHCWLKGGDACPAMGGQNQLHALFGDGPCYAVHPSDLAPALLALEAKVRLGGAAGEVELPLAELFVLPEDTLRHEVDIANDELLLSVHLPPLPEGTRSTYLKAMDRKTWSFALVGVAAVMRMEGARVADARLVLGGVAPIPWRATAAEQVLMEGEISEERVAHAVEQALVGAAPLAHNAYKIPLAKHLIRRAIVKQLAEAPSPCDWAIREERSRSGDMKRISP